MSKLKVAAVILLITITVFGFFQLLEGVKTIESNGKAMGVLTEDGSIYFKCDQSNSNPCSIEIMEPVQ